VTAAIGGEPTSSIADVVESSRYADVMLRRARSGKDAGMIDGATIEGFRGLRLLEVDGFGRVNLIIGKNDCGKTALLEVLKISDDPVGVVALQLLRRSRDPKKEWDAARDFDRFWRPLFWGLDAERGFSISVRSGGRHRRTRFQKSPSPPTLADVLSGTNGGTWALSVEVSGDGERAEHIVGTAEKVLLPAMPIETSSLWIAPLYRVGTEEIGFFSRLKQAGRDGELLDVLRIVDERVSGVELLALSGAEAELFVRLGPGEPLLALSSMGDGFQRCFQIGVTAAARDKSILFVDEIENGLHHSTLEQLWRWLAIVARTRDLQVFATTHSEECIQAARRAFTALDDDGLRVIRLDRREDRTTAAIYDRTLVETAAEAGVEIRG
jgi:hypothetical protein